MHATHKVTAREKGNTERSEKKRAAVEVNCLLLDSPPTRKGARGCLRRKGARKARYKVLMLAGDGRRGGLAMQFDCRRGSDMCATVVK